MFRAGCCSERERRSEPASCGPPTAQPGCAHHLRTDCVQDAAADSVCAFPRLSGARASAGTKNPADTEPKEHPQSNVFMQMVCMTLYSSAPLRKDSYRLSWEIPGNLVPGPSQTPTFFVFTHAPWFVSRLFVTQPRQKTV